MRSGYDQVSGIMYVSSKSYFLVTEPRISSLLHYFKRNQATVVCEHLPQVLEHCVTSIQKLDKMMTNDITVYIMAMTTMPADSDSRMSVPKT